VDVGQIGAEPMIGERVRALRVVGIGHTAFELKQNGLPREPVFGMRLRRNYHFWEPYQSSMSRRT
jgi:hypothetical protein